MFRVSIFLSLLIGGFSAFAHSHANYKIDFPLNGVTAFLTWETQPAVDNYASVLVEVVDSRHRPIDLTSTLSANVTMPSMNHGEVPTAIERVLSNDGQIVVGSYRITNMSFFMTGVWLVSLKLTKNDGAEETGSFKIKMLEGGGHSDNPDGDDDGHDHGHH